MKDYSRKNYSDYSYRDWMRSSPSKAIWNSILSQNVGYGEFTVNKGSKSSVASSVALYLKQSELKKPYMDRGFVQMEDDWEGPPGFTPRGPEDVNWPDFPWSVGLPGDGPWSVVFDIESSSCWCPEETRNFAVTGTHPIYSLGISGHKSGTSINITGGLGTNLVSGTITAASNEIGSVNFTGSMRTSGGVAGSSNVLMYKCRDCNLCDITDDLAEGSNPETIDQSSSETILVIDGIGPFDWTVSGGTGFTLDEAQTSDRGNTLIASAASCGTANITCTDFCGDSVSFQVRSTSVTSDWVGKSSNCVIGGDATEGDGRTRIIGGKKQYQGWKAWGECYNNIGCGCGTACYDGGWTECITLDCVVLAGAGFERKGGSCCERDSGEDRDCVFHNTFNNPNTSYWEWECV